MSQHALITSVTHASHDAAIADGFQSVLGMPEARGTQSDAYLSGVVCNYFSQADLAGMF